MSLAVADMLVAVMVMPFGAVYQVSDEWTMGPEVCDVWTSSDVLCCTASILHLVSIALDRYVISVYVALRGQNINEFQSRVDSATGPSPTSTT